MYVREYVSDDMCTVDVDECVQGEKGEREREREKSALSFVTRSGKPLENCYYCSYLQFCKFAIFSSLAGSKSGTDLESQLNEKVLTVQNLDTSLVLLLRGF